MERDTDQDWDRIGRSHPYHGVLSNPQFLNPGPEDLKEFFASGEHDVRHVVAMLTDAFGPFDPKSALDFGCGVGRLLIPLARQCGTALGVDISEPMLELARRHCQEAGVNFELSKTIPTDRQFDLVNTIIVMQHIPPARGYGIVRQLWNCVAPGGCLSMHITVYKDARHTGELTRDLNTFSYDGATAYNFTDTTEAPGSMSMYDYNLSHVFAQMSLKPGARVFLDKTDHGGCHGFFICSRKT